jgi:hypothetical protein
LGGVPSTTPMVFRQPARVIKAGGTDNHSAPITAGQGQTTMLVIAVVDAVLRVFDGDAGTLVLQGVWFDAVLRVLNGDTGTLGETA